MTDAHASHEYAIDYGSRSRVPPCVCGLGFDHEAHGGDGLLGTRAYLAGLERGNDGNA